jgi:hypothetical protein
MYITASNHHIKINNHVKKKYPLQQKNIRANIDLEKSLINEQVLKVSKLITMSKKKYPLQQKNIRANIDLEKSLINEQVLKVSKCISKHQTIISN